MCADGIKGQMKKLVLFIVLLAAPLYAKSIVTDWTFNGSSTVITDSTGRAPNGTMYANGSPATSWVSTPYGKAFDCHQADGNGGVIPPSTYTNYASTITVAVWWANTASVINNPNDYNGNILYKAYSGEGGDSNSSFLICANDDEGVDHYGGHNGGRAITWWFFTDRGTNAQCEPFSNGWSTAISSYIASGNPLCILPKSTSAVCAIMSLDSTGATFRMFSATDTQKCFISTADMWTYYGYLSPPVPFNIAYDNGIMNLLTGQWGEGSLAASTVDPVYRIAILDYTPTDAEALVLAKGSTPPPTSSGICNNISLYNLSFH